jgi:hypothetical protein
MDVLDRNGEEMLSAVDIGSNLHLVKQPWSGDFDQIKNEVFGVKSIFDFWPNKYQKELKLWNALWKKVLPKAENRPCLPCYEASKRSTKPNMCCNNCYQLKQAYAMSNLPIEDAEKLPQVCIDVIVAKQSSVKKLLKKDVLLVDMHVYRKFKEDFTLLLVSHT